MNGVWVAVGLLTLVTLFLYLANRAFKSSLLESRDTLESILDAVLDPHIPNGWSTRPRELSDDERQWDEELQQ